MTISEQEIQATQSVQREINKLKRRKAQTEDSMLQDYYQNTIDHFETCLLRCFAEATADLLIGTGTVPSAKNFQRQ